MGSYTQRRLQQKLAKRRQINNKLCKNYSTVQKNERKYCQNQNEDKSKQSYGVIDK